MTRQADLSAWVEGIPRVLHDCRIDDPISRLNGLVPACELPRWHPDYEPPSVTP